MKNRVKQYKSGETAIKDMQGRMGGLLEDSYCENTNTINTDLPIEPIKKTTYSLEIKDCELDVLVFLYTETMANKPEEIMRSSILKAKKLVHNREVREGFFRW